MMFISKLIKNNWSFEQTCWKEYGGWIGDKVTVDVCSNCDVTISNGIDV